jgi:hypothetical protein
MTDWKARDEFNRAWLEFNAFLVMRGFLIAEFRREVRDKLAVAAHCGPDAPLKGRARDVLKQCEDFLVEQFEPALRYRQL